MEKIPTLIDLHSECRSRGIESPNVLDYVVFIEMFARRMGMCRVDVMDILSSIALSGGRDIQAIFDRHCLMFMMRQN